MTDEDCDSLVASLTQTVFSTVERTLMEGDKESENGDSMPSIFVQRPHPLTKQTMGGPAPTKRPHLLAKQTMEEKSDDSLISDEEYEAGTSARALAASGMPHHLLAPEEEQEKKDPQQHSQNGKRLEKMAAWPSKNTAFCEIGPADGW